MRNFLAFCHNEKHWEFFFGFFQVSEEYRLVPETLYLTVNYIDRYLSGNVISRQKLQLLGVACMMIASKYEEICAPQVEEFCYITDNTYLKDEVCCYMFKQKFDKMWSKFHYLITDLFEPLYRFWTWNLMFWTT